MNAAIAPGVSALPFQYREVMRCRGCGGPHLTEFWSAGKINVVEFPKIGERAKKPPAPLTLCVCETCWLVQLKHTVHPALLYEEFWYRSSTNEMMREHLSTLVKDIEAEVKLYPNDVILDIGCNDGYLLGCFEDGLKVGMDPAKNIVYQDIPCCKFVQDYFSALRAFDASDGQKFKVITAIAMFYDLDDPLDFLKQVKLCLRDDGIFVVQMNYLVTMFENRAFDNISHEHLTYFTLTTLKRLFAEAGLTIYKAETNAVNGGSIRVYASPQYHKEQHDSVATMLALEERLKLTNSLSKYCQFTYVVSETCKTLNHWIQDLYSHGKKIYAYGASTRGTTLLQLLDVGVKIVACAERDNNKYGRYMVGVDLPIISEEEARKQADYFFVLPWHFEEAIRAREAEWMSNGGRLIFPLPYPHTAEWNPWK